jgi:hypothetical protein
MIEINYGYDFPGGMRPAPYNREPSKRIQGGTVVVFLTLTSVPTKLPFCFSQNEFNHRGRMLKNHLCGSINQASMQ